MENPIYKFNFIITDVKIPSVNSLYIPKYVYQKGRRVCLGMFMNPDAVKFKEQLQNQLYKDGYRRDEIKRYGTKFYKLSLVYVLKRSFLKRDTDNCSKCVQDSIMSYFDVNDVYVQSTHQEKFYNPKSDFESVLCKLEVLMDNDLESFSIDNFKL